MHEARSIAALKLADHMLAIWDGQSKGTAGEIKLAEKMGTPTTVVRLTPRTHFSGAIEVEMPELDALVQELQRANNGDKKG